MHEERRMILRMLEEGKITAEEAEALLKALGESAKSPEVEAENQEDPWVRLEKMGEEFASKVEIATERFALFRGQCRRQTWPTPQNPSTLSLLWV